MTNSRLNIVFIGCVSFSELMLDTLSSISEINTCGIVTRSSSAFNSDFVDLGTHNCAAQSSVFYYEKSKDELFFQWLKNIAPDYIFCFGWSTLLPRRILDIPKYGVVGYHPSLLPRNRGRHPIIWALALGLTQTGSTFFFMDHEADSGPILSQSKVEISLTDNAGSLYSKICVSAVSQLKELCHEFIQNTHKAKPQDPRLATSWRKRTYEDGKIDWRMSSLSIYNLIRALSHPYPGADGYLAGQDFKIWDAEIGEPGLPDVEPGVILSLSERIHVQCGDNSTIYLKKFDLQSGILLNQSL